MWRTGHDVTLTVGFALDERLDFRLFRSNFIYMQFSLSLHRSYNSITPAPSPGWLLLVYT